MSEQTGLKRLLSHTRDPAFWGDNAALIGLLIIGVVFSLASPYFLTWGNLTALLVSASILIVLATAQQFTIVTAGIDLSIAANLPWSAVVFGLIYNGGWGMTAALIGTVLAGALVLTTLLNGFTLLQISSFYQPMAVGIVVIAAAILSRFQR